MMNNKLIIIVLSLLLGSCSILSPIKNNNLKTYNINTLPDIKHYHKISKTISVSKPLASNLYETKEMAYSLRRYSIDYFVKNRWISKPADMLQPLIIQSLINTNHFKSVAPSFGIGRFDVTLNTQILQFHQEFFGSKSVFKLKIHAELIKVSNGKILASKEFYIIEPSPYCSPYGGVIAANRATEKMLSQLVGWLAGRA
ncbi:ABC-type transport auxiliary lipoprotein family protein [Gammaproteobacteria bacterium]|nr:ABC-type transport auxiliary lipoprotein family protein [Gammaproteobacteria bacterium]